MVANQQLVLPEPGTDVMIIKIFSPKHLAKMAFLFKLPLVFAKKIDHNIVFKKANFFAENRQKSQKIVFTTSTPGCNQR
jgi:hypothetical protein